MRASAGHLKRDGVGVGTAWWISDRHLLTARHCLQGSKPGRPEKLAVDFDLEGRNAPVRVRVRALDRTSPGPEIDAAVLEVVEPTEADVAWQPLRLAPFGALRDAIGELAWEAYGFPEAHSTGLHASGTVDRRTVPAGPRSEAQLTCTQGGTSGLQGFSGGPVVVRGRAVALIRNGPEDLRQRVILAPCIEDVAEAYPDVVRPHLPRLPETEERRSPPETWEVLEQIRQAAPEREALRDFILWLLPHRCRAPDEAAVWERLRLDVVHAAYEGRWLDELATRLDAYQLPVWSR